MWLDHEHGIVLRYEQHGVPKKFGGDAGYRYAVIGITFGQGPSDADLASVPPVAVHDVPEGSGTSGGSGSDSGMEFQAPPGFIAVGPPSVKGTSLSLQGVGFGDEFLSDGTSYVMGTFRGGSRQGFVYVKERIRALGLPVEFMTGTVQAAGSCRVWTGHFTDGLRWLAMSRGTIAILVVANKLTEVDLVHYAATGICTAPIAPPLTAREVRNTALDHLETEINITRQILGWAIRAAPSASDKSTLITFDKRLQALDRTVFAIHNRDNPKAAYSSPSITLEGHHAFKDTLRGLKGEIGLAKSMLAQAAATLQTSADKTTLQQRGTVFDDLVRAVDVMVQA